MTKQTHPNLPQHRHVKPTMQEGERNGGSFPSALSRRIQPTSPTMRPDGGGFFEGLVVERGRRGARQPAGGPAK